MVLTERTQEGHVRVAVQGMGAKNDFFGSLRRAYEQYLRRARVNVTLY